MFIGRHTQSNFNRLFPGYLDRPDHTYKPKTPEATIPDLSPLGRRQAEPMREFVVEHQIEGVVTARTRRAFQTGVIATSGLDIPLFVDSGLNEVDWGELSGRLTKNVLPKLPPVEGACRGLDFRPHPSVETPLEAADRVRQALQRQRENRGSKLNTDRLLYIMSGFAMRSLFAEDLGWDRREMIAPEHKIGNGQVVWYDIMRPQDPETVFVPHAAPLVPGLVQAEQLAVA